MSKTYTYLVDHGEDSPVINRDTEVNGGRLIAVAFDDYFKRLEDAEKLLEKINESNDLRNEAIAIQVENFLKI